MSYRPRLDNRHLFLASYTLANAWVVWAFGRGLLDEWCQRCGGAGEVHQQPCALCAGTGDVRHTELHPSRLRDFDLSQADPIRCPDCWRSCPDCRGSKLAPSPELCEQDFGDDQDIAVAELLPRSPYNARFFDRHLR